MTQADEATEAVGGNGLRGSDPLDELRKRHRYLRERTSEVFEIPGFQHKLGVRLRVLSRDEIQEIAEQAGKLRREGVENWDLIDNTDTLLRATEAIMWRTSKAAPWKGLHEYPSADTDRPIKFDARLAAILGVEDEIDRGENAEAESRQVLWIVWADTLRVTISHEDYMMWRTFADEDAADEVKAELESAEPGEADSAT